MICSARSDWNSSSINCQMSQSNAVDNRLGRGEGVVAVTRLRGGVAIL